MTEVIDRPWFKGIDIRKILIEKFSTILYRIRLLEEAIEDFQKNIPGQYVFSYKKFFGGISLVFVWTDRDIAQHAKRKFSLTSLYLTSFGLYIRNFLKGRAPWGMIIHEVNPMRPLFLKQIRRTWNFLERFPEQARLAKEFILYLPTCPVCNEKFFWRYIVAKTFEERYIHFDNRDLYCANPVCRRHNKVTGLRLTDIKLGNDEDTKLFVEPLLRAERRRRESLLHNPLEELPLPRQWIRYWIKRGYSVTDKPGVYANDVAAEKMLEALNKSPYPDLQFEKLQDENPYPNG